VLVCVNLLMIEFHIYAWAQCFMSFLVH
jgi:hypothetical protein